MAAKSTIEGLESRIKKLGTQEQIDAALNSRGITLDSLIGQLHAIAYNNISDSFIADKFGRFTLDLSHLSKEQMAGIAEVMVDVSSMIPHPHDPKKTALKAERIKIKVLPKTDAIMALVRLLSGDVGNPVGRPPKSGGGSKEPAGKQVSELSQALADSIRRRAEVDPDKPPDDAG